MKTTSDELVFKKQLAEQSINVVVLRNDTGRIYGITFIDHNSKVVWNGSTLGNNLFANVFNDWWNNNIKSDSKEPEIKQPVVSTAKDLAQPLEEPLSTYSTS